MSKNWYLNRYKNPPSEIRRNLSKPPYHVHPELEDELTKIKEEASELSEFAAKLRRDHNYHFTHKNGLLEKTKVKLDNKISALDGTVKTLLEYMQKMDERLKAIEKVKA